LTYAAANRPRQGVPDLILAEHVTGADDHQSFLVVMTASLASITRQQGLVWGPRAGHCESWAKSPYGLVDLGELLLVPLPLMRTTYSGYRSPTARQDRFEEAAEVDLALVSISGYRG
jgi:hypothetical protein